MQTLKLLDPNTVAFAYTFLRDAEDEDPIGRGVDELPAYPVRRGGVFRALDSEDPAHAITSEDDFLEVVTHDLEEEHEDEEGEADVEGLLAAEREREEDLEDERDWSELEADAWSARAATEVSVAETDDDPSPKALHISKAGAIARR